MDGNQNQPIEPEVVTNPNYSNPEAPKSDDNLMGILCYLGPLVLIPFLTKKDDAFIQYHAKQGMVLFGIELIFVFFDNYIYMLSFGLLAPIVMLIQLGLLILTILGIVNVLQKKEVALPIIGGWAKYVNF